MTQGPARLNIHVNYAVARKGIPSAISFKTWTTHTLRGRIRSADVGIRLVDAEESQQLNHAYRNKNYPTNVLSFPADFDQDFVLPPEVSIPPLGDIVICAPVIAREAQEQGKTMHAHYAHMTVHGVLHLLGWDHMNDKDAEAMEQLEREILAELGISDPYSAIA